jgi:hypothetical protein
MTRLLAAIVICLLSLPLSADQDCRDNCGGPFIPGGGMPRYVEKEKDTKQSDETLTVMILVGSGIAALVIGASFWRETAGLNAIKRQQPWDL